MFSYLSNNAFLVFLLMLFSLHTTTMFHTEPWFSINIRMDVFFVITQLDIIPLGIIKWLAHLVWGGIALVRRVDQTMYETVSHIWVVAFCGLAWISTASVEVCTKVYESEFKQCQLMREVRIWENRTRNTSMTKHKTKTFTTTYGIL